LIFKVGVILWFDIVGWYSLSFRCVSLVPTFLYKCVNWVSTFEKMPQIGLFQQQIINTVNGIDI